MDPNAQESAVNTESAPGQTAVQLQAQIAALKAKMAQDVAKATVDVATATSEVATATAKVAKQTAKKVKAKAAKKAAKNGKKAAKKEKSAAKSEICTFEDCGRKTIAKGLCPSHYRQQIRGGELKALRPLRGLVRLPMVIRVEQETFDRLEKRVKSGEANSMYDATRQALEAGIATWK